MEFPAMPCRKVCKELWANVLKSKMDFDFSEVQVFGLQSTLPIRNDSTDFPFATYEIMDAYHQNHLNSPGKVNIRNVVDGSTLGEDNIPKKCIALKVGHYLVLFIMVAKEPDKRNQIGNRLVGYIIDSRSTLNRLCFTVAEFSYLPCSQRPHWN